MGQQRLKLLLLLVAKNTTERMGNIVPTADSRKPPANRCAPLVDLLAIIESFSYGGTATTPPPLRFGSSQPAFGNRR